MRRAAKLYSRVPGVIPGKFLAAQTLSGEPAVPRIIIETVFKFTLITNMFHVPFT